MWCKCFWCEETSTWFGEKVFVIWLSSAAATERALAGFKIALLIEALEILGKLCSLVCIWMCSSFLTKDESEKWESSLVETACLLHVGQRMSTQKNNHGTFAWEGITCLLEWVSRRRSFTRKVLERKDVMEQMRREDLGCTDLPPAALSQFWQISPDDWVSVLMWNCLFSLVFTSAVICWVCRRRFHCFLSLTLTQALGILPWNIFKRLALLPFLLAGLVWKHSMKDL